MALEGALAMRVIALFMLMAGVVTAAGAPRLFDTVVNLETTSEESANVSMGDLDGDGDLDLVLAKGRHSPLIDRVLLSNGKGAFTASDLGPTADRTYTAALADFDGDGDLDVLTSNDTPDKKMVYLNNGKGLFTVNGTWGVAKWSTRNASVADLNGDGKVDVIAANRPGPSYVCLNLGGGRFASDCIRIPAKSATSIVPADFDKDGFVDLAVPSRDGGQSHIYFNDGKAGFARTAPFGPSDAAARVGAAADFNGDGSTDLVVGDEMAASMVVYMNDGKGRLTRLTRSRRATSIAMAIRTSSSDTRPVPTQSSSTTARGDSSQRRCSAMRRDPRTALRLAISTATNFQTSRWRDRGRRMSFI
jgi:hypothetical protein